MRKLTDTDITNLTGAIVKGYHVEGVRIKQGSCTDSDHYGFVLGKNSDDHYVTWEFYLDENDNPNVYWGHYYMENREAAIRDFCNRE